ncbi:DUF4232 domain-containing protein [Streptomyces lichenis]|uniref:DUF4232 domain-containing protein n=1 Tax=Streptomyces lichenis TaxID=2306967 RepID=A0ABT0IDL8_9ACTN|nr:DUF4232 domain-containing protein [Streptomyces lichenis]MCK8679396.1 DUF4232 domain-containing protein [Streptomyces lichenis]
MRARKLTLVTLAAVAGLSLTACQNDDGGTAQSPASGTPTSAPASGPSDSPTTSPSSVTPSPSGGTSSPEADSSGGSTTGKIGKCRTDELEITAQDSTIDGDRDGLVAVTLKNGGGRDCSLSAYAGVDLKTNAGPLSAERTGEKADPYVLKDGKSVSFAVSYPKNDSGGSGVRVTGLVVTPPDETKSVTLDWPGAATLPVTEGGGNPVKLGPIGSAGQGD